MSLLLMLWLSVVPQGELLVKGAMPSASDASTPVPEQGSVAAGRYRNAYFGLTYPIPAGWTEQPAGPPPSDGGAYVLTQFALYGPDRRLRAHVLVTAQDLFFTLLEAADAKELLAAARRGAESQYVIESGPAEVTIAGRTFHRLGYRAPRSGLQWRVLSTDTRCHALTFTFTGTDPALLDAAERGLSAISLADTAPACVNGYALGDNVVERTDPMFATNRYNTIPVRLLVDAKGRVKHIHLLSAFPEQSQAILAALRTWRFKPYRVGGKAVEVETGMLFGNPRPAIH
ncbi:MAG TPA: hypothetical protein VEK57_21030 [Thermoanaerobaculia bacterium]|nr:hypothetical protein [Thermoanaerobaculia bacterium]